MARRYSQIAADIWKNEDFRKLSAGAQRLYMILFSQADISPAGVLPMTVKRWASYAPDTTEDDIRAAIDELSDALFVVPDHETEELLVRSFVRWDGGHKNPKRLIAIGMAYRSVTSYPIDRALTREFTRLGVSFDGLSDSLSDVVSDRHRVVVKEGSNQPQPTTRNPQPQPDPVVAEIFDAWCSTIDGSRKFNDDRRRAIVKALKSFPAEDVKDAVRGWVNDPWQDRATNNDIPQLLRNVEKFRDMFRNPPKPRLNGHQTYRNPTDMSLYDEELR